MIVYYDYLSELKNILYSDKKITVESKEIINNIIKDKIKKSLIQKEIKITETETETETETDNSYTLEDSESEDSYKEDIRKIYNRNDKKGDNQKFTQTSQKLYDRMFSQAQIINQSYMSSGSNNTVKISKPFISDNSNNRKLGERRFINK